jgi:hypothetical protein
MSREVVWLVGRGVSASCGLNWEVPPSLYEAFRRGELGREALIARIRKELAAAQDAALASGCARLSPLANLLRALFHANRSDAWSHLFVTTNWDTLLDHALAAHHRPGRTDIGRRVQHLNGSIAAGGEHAFLTEADSQDEREAALEAHPGFQQLLRANLCVLAGMSLQNRADKELVARLGTRQGWLPAGESWIVVNHNAREIARVSELLRAQLPRSRVAALATPFDGWVESGLPELVEHGVLRGAHRSAA